jgi:hypothetical protein
MKKILAVLALLLQLQDGRLFAADFAAESRRRVRVENWKESQVDVAGRSRVVPVTAEVWTEAFQAELDRSGSLHIPARDHPYYIDGPLVLKSGQRILAETGAEIRLKPGSNTCMVRNENVTGFADIPVPADTRPDTDLRLEGGIWTTLAVTPDESNGNLRGASSKPPAVAGTHGVILLQNVRRVVVRNLTVRQCRAFGVHLANARNFLVENLTLDGQRRDGVHVNGPASDGVIRGVRGDSHDDNVALNAWEWQNYAPSHGPIERVVIEDVTGAPSAARGADSIRLLPGVKRFSDGTLLECPIADITLRNITDIRDFKLYDQPNLEVGRDKDCSHGIGTLRNITFENLTFHRPGSIQVHANTNGLTVRGVKLLFPPPADYRLVELGPKSMTYRGAPGTDPSRWVEVFSPDLDCVVRNVAVSDVRSIGATEPLPIERVVKVVEQRPNPEYPKTTPRGGTGKAVWIR